MKDLQELRLREFKITGTCFKNFKKLKFLSIKGCDNISEKNFKYLQNLETFHIMNQLIDISKLSLLKNLTGIAIHGFKGAKYGDNIFNYIKDLKNLKDILVFYCNKSLFFDEKIQEFKKENPKVKLRISFRKN